MQDPSTVATSTPSPAVFDSRRLHCKSLHSLWFSEDGAGQPARRRCFHAVLDRSRRSAQDLGMSSAAVRKLIALASELSDDERRVLVDAIASEESVASLADEWEAEIARRAQRVRSDPTQGKPSDEVFERLESKLKTR
jgi:putative addiction module component (TIGR02574 family)